MFIHLLQVTALFPKKKMKKKNNNIIFRSKIFQSLNIHTET
jgi:hypothetical protein